MIRQLARYFMSWLQPGRLAANKVYTTIKHPANLDWYESVEIIIPTRDKAELLRACVDSISPLLGTNKVSITVVNNQSVELKSRDYFKDLSDSGIAKVIDFNEDFNFSKICNVAISESAAKIICLLNNDTLALSPDWLENMMAHINSPGVGLVGATLEYQNGEVQHNGIFFREGGIAANLRVLTEAQKKDSSLCLRADGATFACALFKRETWETIGGLDEAFPVGLNDVDFSKRVLSLGQRVEICSKSRLIHRESATRPSKLTVKGFVQGFRDVRVFLKNNPDWFQA